LTESLSVPPAFETHPVEFEPAGGQLLKLGMSITRNIIVAAALAAIALPAGASAAGYNAREYNCVVTQTVKPRPYVDKSFFDYAEPYSDSRPRHISVGTRTVTYVLADPSKSFTLPVMRTDAHGNVVSEGWAGGMNRWLSVGNGGFMLVNDLANGNKAAFSGRCAAGNGMPAVAPPAQQRPPTQQSSTWTVPIQRHGKAIILNGTVNDTLPVRWTLDTGASLSTIPQEMADRLRARVIDTRKFELADGTVITSNIVVIAKLSVGGVVSASNVHAAVSGYGTDPLLGKNFLDYFGSYEINNRSAQLVLRR
jgi:predicted aspartyl protease